MHANLIYMIFGLNIICCSSYAYVDSHDSLSDREKVIFLFSTFDISKKNGYLGYTEIELFQKLTDPQLPLDMPTYRYIIQLLGGNMRYGLTRDQFNSSYYLHRNTLGTDLRKDYTIIRNIINQIM